MSDPSEKLAEVVTFPGRAKATLDDFWSSVAKLAQKSKAEYEQVLKWIEDTPCWYFGGLDDRDHWVAHKKKHGRIVRTIRAPSGQLLVERFNAALKEEGVEQQRKVTQ